jgi:hypothetical protein
LRADTVEPQPADWRLCSAASSAGGSTARLASRALSQAARRRTAAIRTRAEVQGFIGTRVAVFEVEGSLLVETRAEPNPLVPIWHMERGCQCGPHLGHGRAARWLRKWSRTVG